MEAKIYNLDEYRKRKAERDRPQPIQGLAGLFKSKSPFAGMGILDARSMTCLVCGKEYITNSDRYVCPACQKEKE
ncbi:MAG: hypothetical protein GY861_01120 [bacterium]|nr:hypothetical protein [bacterium]